MIEFKAECGHTVRAKDEDAGGVVRCSYCGRQSTVPANEDEHFNFLFNDVQRQEPADDGAGRRKQRGTRRLRARQRRSPGRFDPFAVVFRMCYVALLLSILIFVGRRYVLPLFKEGGAPSRLVDRPEEPLHPQPERRTNERAPPSRQGLLAAGSITGLYVGSTPPGAAVYCVEASQSPPQGRIHELEGCVQTRANGGRLRLSDATYVVEVVLPWNNPSLNDRNLPFARQYRAFRRAIERASDRKRIQLLEDFFVPDEAQRVFIDQTDEQIYIVRQYHDVRVRNGRSKGVRALFLPRIVEHGKESYSIDALVAHYLPKQAAYGFDENHVRNELDYYGVPESDRLPLVEALQRIGVIPYVTEDRNTLLFKIGIDDGTFAVKPIHKTGS